MLLISSFCFFSIVDNNLSLTKRCIFFTASSISTCSFIKYLCSSVSLFIVKFLCFFDILIFCKLYIIVHILFVFLKCIFVTIITIFINRMLIHDNVSFI